jgi:predicted O-methyltransferase YrrM
MQQPESTKQTRFSGSLNKAESIMRKIEKKARNEFLPIVGPVKGQIIAEEIRKANPKSVLEVGTLIGYSAVLMGKELDSTAQIITIEIHADEVKAAEKNIRNACIAPKVEVIIGDAIQVIPKLKAVFDFVFIDAEKKEYLDYLRLAEDKLHKGTVIVADNTGVFANQMADYLDYVRTSGKYRSRYVAVNVDGLEISVKL